MARIDPSDEKDRQLTASEDSADYSFHSEGDNSSNQGSESCVESRVLFASPEGDFITTFEAWKEHVDSGGEHAGLGDSCKATTEVQGHR